MGQLMPRPDPVAARIAQLQAEIDETQRLEDHYWKLRESQAAKRIRLTNELTALIDARTKE